ncbi:MAG: hypothetical protein KatS3mg125_0460 [Lysobacterales bacterium]|nr:MAG: hypothetical protein KatS3mg125_0460 [Xanthomonadales bacterium]
MSDRVPRCRVRAPSSLPACAFAALLLACVPAGLAQTVGGTWFNDGPRPAHNGQVENIPNRPVTGAIEALAPHPSNPDILYAASVGGGIWRTSNATAAAPSWTHQTPNFSVLAMGAIGFDPSDATHQTLVAGTGCFSSYGSCGTLLGMMRTTDGGNNWSVLNPGGPLATRSIRAVIARGSTLLAATNAGIYRSINTGSSFTLISGATGSGLPAGNSSDLVGRPGAPATLYTTVISGSAPGVYRSLDAGATWSKVSSSAMDTNLAGATRARIAVGAPGQVFVGIVRSGRLFEVYRSPDGTTGWTALGVPLTTEEGGVQFGIHPGQQGSLHFSIAVDPTDTNIVYVGGDRQPYFGEGVPSSPNVFPNSIGANDFTGRLFRGNASLPPASRWAPLTHIGTANNSSPHADSRDIEFDANGDLLECDDGGVFKRSSPRTSTGVWSTLNTNLSVSEIHGIAWDALSNRLVSGTQDNGTHQQRHLAGSLFDVIMLADGGDVAVEDRLSASASQRLISIQFLGNFQRRSVDASNALLAVSFPALTPTSGSPAIDPQFYTPIAVNHFQNGAVVFGADNGLYESADWGSTITRISVARVNAFRGDPLVYGIPGQPGYLLFGSGSQVYRRSSGSAPINAIADFSPATLFDVAVDPDAPNRLFAVTGNDVFYSQAPTPSFGSILGNLVSAYNPGLLRTLAYVDEPDRRAIVLGADRGVYIAYLAHGFQYWFRLGNGLANAPVFELEYDNADDVLVAGLLGRGAWILGPIPLPPALPVGIFADGFENP